MQSEAVPRIQVVAAVLRDRRGRVLVADRPAGKPMAGMWEFPGGKLEPGEPAADALRRELQEELGIRVQHAYRLLRFSHRYPEREVDLDVWRVTRHAGEPKAHEGQKLAWHLPAELHSISLLPADAPIVAALTLPPLLLVTPAPGDEAGFLRSLERSLEAGIDWVQFRAPGLGADVYAAMAEKVLRACRAAGAQVSLHGHPDLAIRLGADGLHLGQAAVRQLSPGQTPRGLHLGISCHSEAELARALAFHPDYVTLGPVQATASHPGTTPLGWEAFARLAAASPVPVYAVGGLGPGSLERARRRGAHGVAAIRQLWGVADL